MTKKINQFDKQYLLDSLQGKKDEYILDNKELKEFEPPKNINLGNRYEFSLNFNTYIKGAGVIINPSLLPNHAKTYFVNTIFGLTDFYSTFYTTDNFILNPSNWYYAAVGIYKFNFAIGGYVPTIKNGDLIKYAINQTDVNYQMQSVFSSNNNIGYGTFLNNLTDNKFVINHLKIIVPTNNYNQFQNPLIFSKLYIDGKLKTEKLDLQKFVTPNNFNKNIVSIPLNVLLDKNLIINWAVNYDCQQAQFIFDVTKIIN